MTRPGDAYQLSLIDTTGRMHSHGGDTESGSAIAMRPTTHVLRELVLSILREHPDGLTDDEGAVRMTRVRPRADRLTFGRRRQELCTAGLVRDSGRLRRTPSGRWAIVWIAP